jgi:hypothetical protein
VSGGGITLTGNVSAGSLFATNITTTNANFTIATAGTLNVSTGISAGNVNASFGNFTNTVASLVVTCGTLYAGNGTLNNLIITGSTISNIRFPSSVVLDVVTANHIGTTTFNGTQGTISNLIVTNIVCAATPGAVNIGNVGSPSHHLQLSTDSAAKPSTSTWTISSDSRLKTNVTIANLDLCYNTIKNIPLKRYTWREDVYTEDQVKDRTKLGWIAQDVESVFPKAVEQINAFGYSDCRTLNTDQLLASLYGAVQSLISKYEHDVTELRDEIGTLKSFIQSKYPNEL